MIDTSLALSAYESSKINSHLNTKDSKKLKEQTDKFEALILKQMLDISLKNEDSLFGKTTGSHIYQSMYNNALSEQLRGGFGYSKLLFEFLTKKT